ncbi:MAG: LacI family DNA-binding transcriptional regulator [Planctomycetota bacterium]
MAITIKHIAEQVGVSKQAVSYALNNKPGQVSDSTRKKIIKTAQEMGYRPNWRARSFARKRSQIIGLVYGRPAHYIEQSQLVSHLVQRLSEIDHELLLIPAMGPVEKWAHKLRDGRVDGCLVSHPMPLGLDTFVAEHQLPAVFANLKSDLPVPQICFDDVTGARLAVEHLLELGHRRITYYCMPKRHGEHYSNEDRLQTYRRMMRKAGLDQHVDIVVEDQDDYAQRLAELDPSARPTAILAYNDLDAVALMRELWVRGIEVPRDLSLMGFNDDVARQSSPPLTTVATPIEDMVDQCVDLLMEQIGQSEDRPERNIQPVVLPETLIVRDSTCVLPSD